MPHFMQLPQRLGDVEVGQRVAVGRDDHARAAALAFVGEDGDGRLDRLGHSGNPLLFGLQHGVGNLVSESIRVRAGGESERRVLPSG